MKSFISEDDKRPIRVLISDDHPLMRSSLRHIIERQSDIQIVGEAADGLMAMQLADELNPDVIIMDMTMPKLDGLEATKQIKAKHSNIGILILTVHNEDEIILNLFDAGADGYLIKSVCGEEVIQAIRSLSIGETTVSPDVLKRILKYASYARQKTFTVNDRTKLTIREVEVLKLVAKGLSNKEISSMAGISIPGVKAHLVNIFAKLNTNSRFESIIESLRLGIISLEDIQKTVR